MIKTSDMMMTSPVCIRRETLIADVVELLLHDKINGLPVVDCDGRLVGMFSETDHFKKSQSDREHAPVSTRTTKAPICVTANATVLDRAKNFCERNVHRLPVIVEDRQVVGGAKRRT